MKRLSGAGATLLTAFLAQASAAFGAGNPAVGQSVFAHTLNK
jgi:hypothetical protein